MSLKLLAQQPVTQDGAKPSRELLIVLDDKASSGSIGPAVTAAIAAHVAAPDPHPQYLTEIEGNAAYSALGHVHTASQVVDFNTAADARAAAAIATHEAAGDPHPQYLTSAEGNAAYSLLGHTHTASQITDFNTAADARASAAIVTHEAAADPHPQYLTAAEGSALVAGILLDGSATLNLPTARFEHEETVTATGVTAASRIFLALQAGADTDENTAEMLDLITLAGIPGTDQITVQAQFSGPTRGPILINWSAM